MSSTVEFYHYTNTVGKDAIVRSGYILDKPRGHRKAMFGPGTYGTSLAPSAGRRTIADNNWRTHGMCNIRNGKVDWAIKVNVPSHMVDRFGAEEGRDILVYKGRLYLDTYGYEIVQGPSY